MRKNYFTRSLMAAMMLLSVSSVMVSCDEMLDNPSPQVQEAIETIATITGTDPSAVTNALKDIVSDETVAAAAAKGEPIKVTVAGSGVSTEATDQTITIPQKNGAAIEINFATAPSGTDSNALVLQASEGAGSNPGDANNNLVVSMPASEGLAITIELPNTTVTLKTDGSGNVVYKDVIAKTALSTIIIDKGVTIKEHELVGGNIVVKDGGAIETLAVTIKDDDGIVCLGSGWSGVWFKEDGPEPQYEIHTEDGGFYVPKNVRVKKGGSDHTTAWTNGPADETIESLTAGNGVKLSIMNAQYRVIKGEGDNELRVRGGLEPKDDHQYFFTFTSNTDLVSNFTIKSEIDPALELPIEPYEGEANLIIEYNAVEENGSKTFTFENCDFDDNLQFALHSILIRHTQSYVGFVSPDEQMPMISSNLQDLLDAGIPNNIVKRGQTSGGYWIDDEYSVGSPTCSAFTCILEFKNCTIEGNTITKDDVKFTKGGLWDENNKGIKFKVIIDENTYNAVTKWYGNDDPQNGKIVLE